MSGDQAVPFGLDRMPADCSGRRSNIIHRAIYSPSTEPQVETADEPPPESYPQDTYNLASDGHYWPSGYLGGSDDE